MTDAVKIEVLQGEVVNALVAVSSKAAEIAVGEYTGWFVVNGIVWTVIGLAVMYGATRIKFGGDTDVPPGVRAIVVGIVMLIGGMIVADGLADALNPKAAAIHELMKNARGS